MLPIGIFYTTMLQQRGCFIRAELMRRGLNMADVARRCGVNRATVSRVVSGLARSRPIERCIAKLIGIDRAVLFPNTESSQKQVTGLPQQSDVA